MRFSTLPLLATLAALSNTASAYIAINNWCGMTVDFWVSHNGACDQGPNGICSSVSGSAPYTISASTVFIHNFIADGEGTALKFAYGSDFAAGVLQFEYTLASGTYGGLYWDLSDLDGSGAGLVGSPYMNQNVKISPTGDGSGVNTCLQIKCPAGQLCKDAYNVPDAKDTRWCPADTGTMWIDLCEPTANFNSKRGLTFSA